MLENAGIDLMRLAQIHTCAGTADTVEARLMKPRDCGVELGIA